MTPPAPADWSSQSVNAVPTGGSNTHGYKKGGKVEEAVTAVDSGTALLTVKTNGHHLLASRSIRGQRGIRDDRSLVDRRWTDRPSKDYRLLWAGSGLSCCFTWVLD